MSRYDDLDASSEIEQKISTDLSQGLEKRGFTIKHNGTERSHTPAGLPDIIISNTSIVITVEVTKSKGAAQDRELNSIRDHLNQVKESNSQKMCYCVYISPETTIRMIDGIRDHNNQRVNEGKRDLKILPLSFNTFEIWITHLIESERDLYPFSNFIGLFDSYNEFIDDLRIQKLLVQNIFPSERMLLDAVEHEEIERDQYTLEKLIRDLAKMEDHMRQNGIATSQAAIDTLIYLVFLKLYEEKRAKNGDLNRLRSKEVFGNYLRNSVDEPNRNAKRGIHVLFNSIKQEGQFLNSGMFTQNDNIVDSVNDDFITEYVIPLFSKYTFIGTRIDALGAVYEVLALRAEKDVKVGQFFTPENVVQFMVKLAELDYKDNILDPACGTGRFLIYAMNDMVKKVNASSIRNKDVERENVCLHRLFGADINSRIAKIAKMNMWIHGDGKSNIFGGHLYNGLLLYKHTFNSQGSFDGSFDVVLTNPPLGEINYKSIAFDAQETGNSQESIARIINRVPILPRKNLTEEKLKEIRKRLVEYQQDLHNLNQVKETLVNNPSVKEWLELGQRHPLTKTDRARQRELIRITEVQSYKKNYILNFY